MLFYLWDRESVGRRKVPTISSKLIMKDALKNWAETEFDNSLPDTDYCSAALHSQNRSVLGQVNWRQSRTQYQECYRFSRCACTSASPTIVDARALNKRVRLIRAEPCVLRYLTLKGSLRLVGYPDAAYRHNVDNSSQRGQAIFLLKKGPRPRMVSALWLTLSHTQFIE